MKILFNTYPVAFDKPGGGEVQLLQYQKYIHNKENIDINLFNLWKPDFLNYDIVHYFSCMGGSVHFLSHVKKLELPLIISPNLWVTEETKHLYPFDEIRNDFILADVIIGNSDTECNLLSDIFTMPRGKFLTIYNGIEESFFEPIDTSLFLDHFNISEKFILNVANIEPRKNQLSLIKAMKNFPELKLVMLGYIRDQQYLEECLNEGGNQIIYLGSLPHDSLLLKSAYAACELFALPSTVETPGLAALEAAAMGAKILVTLEGCTQEYFGNYVTYVDPNSEEDIKEGISKSLNKQCSKELYKHMKENFLWSNVVKKLSNTYEKLNNLNRLKRSGKGFKEIEGDGQGNFFMWSDFKPEFEWDNGVLSFLWRSVNPTTLDILVDDEIIESQKEVYQEWTRYSICLQNPSDTKNKVTFNIKDTSDDLNLGIALRDVKFELQN
ncbi:MAG: glycosyltransferase [Sulfurovum sp.]|nr:glycosyltransferase [Sulfurovum sp.]